MPKRTFQPHVKPRKRKWASWLVPARPADSAFSETGGVEDVKGWQFSHVLPLSQIGEVASQGGVRPPLSRGQKSPRSICEDVVHKSSGKRRYPHWRCSGEKTGKIVCSKQGEALAQRSCKTPLTLAEGGLLDCPSALVGGFDKGCTGYLFRYGRFVETRRPNAGRLARCRFYPLDKGRGE